MRHERESEKNNSHTHPTHIVPLHLQVLGCQQTSNPSSRDHHPQRILRGYLVGKLPWHGSVQPRRLRRLAPRRSCRPQGCNPAVLLLAASQRAYTCHSSGTLNAATEGASLLLLPAAAAAA